MRILEGHLDLTFQGQSHRCPIAGVRDTSGQVEIAVATPFGLRRVHVTLDAERRLIEAHTFAFDYTSGEVTKFEQKIEGGPKTDNTRCYAGQISGGGLEGAWTVTELGPFDDDAEEAAYAFGAGLSPRPSKGPH